MISHASPCARCVEREKTSLVLPRVETWEKHYEKPKSCAKNDFKNNENPSNISRNFLGFHIYKEVLFFTGCRFTFDSLGTSLSTFSIGEHKRGLRYTGGTSSAGICNIKKRQKKVQGEKTTQSSKLEKKLCGSLGGW